MPTNSRAAIDRFLSSKRIAIVGVSGRDADFSRHIFREFVKRGYDTIPVNPKTTEVEGRSCYAHITDVAPAPEGAVVMTSPGVSEQVVRECAASGVKRIWLHRGAGHGAVSEAAVQACKENGIEVVAGECPFMFLAGSSFPHNIHAWVKKVTGSYPC